MQQPMYGQPMQQPVPVYGQQQPVMYNPPTMGQPMIVRMSPAPALQATYFVSAPAPQQIVYTPPPIAIVKGTEEKIAIVKGTEEKSLLSHLALALLLLILVIITMGLAAYVTWQLEYNCYYPQLIPKWSSQRFSQQDAIAVANVRRTCVLQILISIPASI